MHEHGVLADVGDQREARIALVVHGHALLVVGAEPDRLTVLQRDQHVGPVLLAGDPLERTVVEDVAVLEDLHERGAVVIVRPTERLDHVLAIHVVRAGDERRLRPERDRQRVERMVERPERRRLRDLPDL